MYNINIPDDLYRNCIFNLYYKTRITQWCSIGLKKILTLYTNVKMCNGFYVQNKFFQIFNKELILLKLNRRLLTTTHSTH